MYQAVQWFHLNLGCIKMIDGWFLTCGPLADEHCYNCPDIQYVGFTVGFILKSDPIRNLSKRYMVQYETDLPIKMTMYVM